MDLDSPLAMFNNVLAMYKNNPTLERMDQLGTLYELLTDAQRKIKRPSAALAIVPAHEDVARSYGIIGGGPGDAKDEELIPLWKRAERGPTVVEPDAEQAVVVQRGAASSSKGKKAGSKRKGEVTFVANLRDDKPVTDPKLARVKEDGLQKGVKEFSFKNRDDVSRKMRWIMFNADDGLLPLSLLALALLLAISRRHNHASLSPVSSLFAPGLVLRTIVCLRSF